MLPLLSLLAGQPELAALFSLTDAAIYASEGDVKGTVLAGLGALPIAGAVGKAVGTAAKTAPVWPKTAQEMNAFLKVEGKAIPDKLTTPGRNKTVWELGPNKITLEQHPYHPNAPTWHKDPHWHLDTPGNPHQRFLPGDPIPGY